MKSFNCDLPQHNTPVKFDADGLFTCDIAALAKDAEFIASERPITGKTTHAYPTLCDTYLYIFPIREALNRVASSLAEFNQFHYLPFQMLVKYQDKQDEPRNVSSLNETKQIELDNGSLYGSLRSGVDLKSFVSFLFNAEDNVGLIIICRALENLLHSLQRCGTEEQIAQYELTCAEKHVLSCWNVSSH